jgi:hypothetical protein
MSSDFAAISATFERERQTPSIEDTSIHFDGAPTIARRRHGVIRTDINPTLRLAATDQAAQRLDADGGSSRQW